MVSPQAIARPRVVVGGEALIDLIMTPEGGFNVVPGGGPYNAARTMARLGVEVSFLGRISDDAFGRLLLGHLREDGVGTDLVVSTQDPTTLVLAEIDALGVPHYRMYLAGTSAPGLELADARRALADATAAIHVGTLGLAVSPMADALASLVAEAADSTLVMCDPNCRPMAVPDVAAFRARMRRVLARADIVKVAREDLEYLAIADTLEEAARAIVAGGARVVLLTAGGEPVRVFWRGEPFEVPSERVQVVDTIGAGDAFGAGFLARWLEQGLGHDDLVDPTRLADAARFGVRVAAIVCGREGADPPRRSEL